LVVVEDVRRVVDGGEKGSGVERDEGDLEGDLMDRRKKERAGFLGPARGVACGRWVFHAAAVQSAHLGNVAVEGWCFKVPNKKPELRLEVTDIERVFSHFVRSS
jgi:hypothetical protein